MLCNKNNEHFSEIYFEFSKPHFYCKGRSMGLLLKMEFSCIQNMLFIFSFLDLIMYQGTIPPTIISSFTPQNNSMN